jgi:flagellar protein FlaI
MTPKPATKNDGDKWRRAARRQERIRTDQHMQEADELEAQAKRLREAARENRRRQAAFGRHQETVSQAASVFGFDPRRPITEVPPLPPGFRELERKTIRAPFAFVRVSHDPAKSERVYEVLEPRLTDTEKEVMAFLRDTLIRTLEGRDRDDPVSAEQALDAAIMGAVVDHAVMVDEVSMQRIRYHLIRDFLGYGPIDVMMQDPELEDISCDGPHVPLYLFHRKYESLRTNVVFEDEDELDSFVIRLAQQSGKHISIADPLLDATLPDGSRLQTTLSREVTTRGSSFTIRKFREDPMTPTDLLTYGTMDDKMAAYLWFLMESGHSVMMAGGTASGKTTTLNAMCQFIPPEKKIVSIEDTREINLRHDNWIAGVTRTGFGAREGGRRSGSIDMFSLLESALRQRPEYLLVGEVRGPEALTLFQAMATGHAVYSTMHADSAETAVYRLENPPISVPRLMLQTLDAMAIQRQVRVGGHMARRVTEVTEFVGFDPMTGDLLTNTVFRWNNARDEHEFLGKSILLDRIQQTQNVTAADIQLEWDSRARVLRWMRARGIRELSQVARIVTRYYHHKQELLEEVERDEALAAQASNGRTSATPLVSQARAGIQSPAAAQSPIVAQRPLAAPTPAVQTPPAGLTPAAFQSPSATPTPLAARSVPAPTRVPAAPQRRPQSPPRTSAPAVAAATDAATADHAPETGDLTRARDIGGAGRASDTGDATGTPTARDGTATTDARDGTATPTARDGVSDGLASIPLPDRRRTYGPRRRTLSGSARSLPAHSENDGARKGG